MFQHELLRVECVRANKCIEGTYKTLDRISQSTGSDSIWHTQNTYFKIWNAMGSGALL